MDEEKKDIPRNYRFDNTTVRILREQSWKVHCSESEFIRRLIRATERPEVVAIVFDGNCQEQAA